MATIKFSSEQKAQVVAKIQKYFHDQLDQQIGAFDAEFLLDFFAEEVGGHFYNQGLADARAAIAAQMENIEDALYALERPLQFAR